MKRMQLRPALLATAVVMPQVVFVGFVFAWMIAPWLAPVR